MDAVTISLAGANLGEVGVPHVGVDFLELNAGFCAAWINEAQLDFRCGFGEDCEVGARAIKRGAQRVGLARSHSKSLSHNAPE